MLEQLLDRRLALERSPTAVVKPVRCAAQARSPPLRVELAAIALFSYLVIVESELSSVRWAATKMDTSADSPPWQALR